jgi:apolipoprotein N-acyltransferase
MNSMQIFVGVGTLIVPLFVWRVRGRRARASARTRVHLVSLSGRVLFNGALIVGIQWVVITHRDNPWLLLAVLGVPALLASYTVTKALTVTSYEPPSRRRGGRR